MPCCSETTNDIAAHSDNNVDNNRISEECNELEYIGSEPSEQVVNKKKRKYHVNKTFRKIKCSFDDWRRQITKVARERSEEYIPEWFNEPCQIYYFDTLCDEN